MQIKSLSEERQQLKSQHYSVNRGLVVQTGRILALHARGPGFKSQRVHLFYIKTVIDHIEFHVSEMDLNTISKKK